MNNLNNNWRQIQADGTLNLNELVQLLNIINQRLCTVEDNTYIKIDNQMLSLTDIYAIQQQQQQEQQVDEPTTEVEE